MFFAFCSMLLVFGMIWLVAFEKCNDGCSHSQEASFFFGALTSRCIPPYCSPAVVLPGVVLWAALTFPALVFQWRLVKKMPYDTCMMCGAYHDVHSTEPLLTAEPTFSANTVPV